MNKKVNKIQRVIFGLTIAQVVFIGLFIAAYALNLFGFAKMVKPVFFVLGCGCLVLLNCITIFIISTVLTNLKVETEVKTADVLSADIQEVYNFAETAIVVTDEKNIVLWESELFQSRHIDLFGLDLISRFPELSVLRDNVTETSVVKVVINNRSYDVKCIQETGVWIFKDISDFETAYRYSKNNAIVLGSLVIDNYEDIVGKGEILNDIDNNVKSLIQTYFKDHGCLVRKIKEDTYFLVTIFEKYKTMKEDNFSILNGVRDFGDKDVNISLSIGFAYDFPDLIKLSEYASNALDVAISRGGDQVVAFPYGREIEFYGGKGSSVDRTNKVKMRSLSDSVFALIKDASDVLIMGHIGMDMDAFGACLGMKAICDRCEREAKIIVDIKNTERKTRAAIMSTFSKSELDSMLVAPKRAESLVTSTTLVIVLDVHEPSRTMAPEILEKASKTMVIDHHRRGKEIIENSLFLLVDPGSSSCSEIVAELIKYCPINPVVELPSTYATFMLSGMFLDSTFFKSDATGLKSFEAAAILKEYGADNSLAADFLKDDYQEHKEVADIISTFSMPYYGIAIAYGLDNKMYDSVTFAKVSDELLTYKGVHAAFAFGKVDNKNIKVSARSDGTVNVQLLSEKLGGGGSFSSAAIMFEGLTVEEAKDKLISSIGEHIFQASSIKIESKED